MPGEKCESGARKEKRRVYAAHAAISSPSPTDIPLDVVYRRHLPRLT